MLRVKIEESESESELNVEDEEDDLEDDDEEDDRRGGQRPVVPRPLLPGARPPLPGLAGLGDLIRPSWPPGLAPPPFPGTPHSMFDKGTRTQNFVNWLQKRPFVNYLQFDTLSRN